MYIEFFIFLVFAAIILNGFFGNKEEIEDINLG